MPHVYLFLVHFVHSPIQKTEDQDNTRVWFTSRSDSNRSGL